MSWDKVLDQDIAKNILKNALKQNKLSGSYLFYGNIGVGKWALALEVAKAINCEVSNTDPCDSCFSCVQINKLIHPDLKLLFPLPSIKDDEKKKKEVEWVKAQKIETPYNIIRFDRPVVVNIDDIREVQKEIGLKPFQSEKKVVIILEAQHIKKEGANSLLKTLEEPPSNTIIILTSSNPNLILPTILSRCQKVRFSNIPLNLIKEKLKEQNGLSEEKAYFYAKISQGSFGRAKELCQEEKEELREKGWEIIQTSLAKNSFEIVNMIEPLEKEKTREDNLQIADFLILFFRDLLALSEDEKEVINADLTDRIVGLLKFLDNFEKIEKAVNLATQVQIDLQRNVNIKLAWLNFCFNLKRTALAKK